jgi:hypothetical protein
MFPLPTMSSTVESNDREHQAIQELCRQIADGLQTGGSCPSCSVTLTYAAGLEGVEASCPAGCFRFEYRRNGVNGSFASGALAFRDPAGQGATASPELP